MSPRRMLQADKRLVADHIFDFFVSRFYGAGHGGQIHGDLLHRAGASSTCVIVHRLTRGGGCWANHFGFLRFGASLPFRE